MNTWLKFGSGLATGALLWMVFPEAMLGKVGRFDPPDLRIDESPLEEPIKAATSFASVVKTASPCVVSIQTVQERSSAAGSMDLDAFRRFFDPEGRFPMPEERDLPAQGTGSGVIVSSDGFILTNFHVVEGTQSISVVLADGTTSLDAEIVGADKHSDLAVLKVQRKGLSAITLGNSDHLEVGDVVLALGSPFGLSQSVTMGIVSATGRAQIGMMDIENFIQTDASINPGNSGGALIDAQGRLIGINTMIMSRSGGNQGIGFAIPVNMARSVMDQMVEYGDVQRGLLGISMQELTESMAKGFGLDSTEGVLVGDVTPEGPAEAGGVIPGDVVVTYDEKPISDMNALKLMVVETSAEGGFQGTGNIDCLNLMPGHVARMESKGVRLPHMGWNTVSHNNESLFEGIPQDTYFYFVHSFAVPEYAHTLASCTYGNTFSAAINKDNFYGVQFHPERSGEAGAQLLTNFVNL